MIRCPTCNRPKDTCPGRACFDARERERLSDVERALLARDAAEVAYHVVDFIEEMEDLETQIRHGKWAIERYGDSAIGAAREHRKVAELTEARAGWVAKVADCQAWLTRARAALAQ